LTNSDDWQKISRGDILSIKDIRHAVRKSKKIVVMNQTTNETYETELPLTSYQVEILLAGSLINLVKKKGLKSAKHSL
jgi:aconitate hydratase